MIFIFPTQEEAQSFIHKAPTAEVIISGVGVVCCGAAVARCAMQHPGQMIILAGIAGGYNISVGEVVEVTEEAIEELPSKYAITYKNPSRNFGLRCVKSNTVSSSGHISESAHIENMEGAALFATCAALGVECAEIRAISNLVGEPFEQWQIAEALEALTIQLLKIWRCE